MLAPQKIALEVKTRIEDYPEHYNQVYFVDSANEVLTSQALFEPVICKPIQEWECGTTACVAGHVVAVAIMHDPEYQPKVNETFGIDYWEEAFELLGIDYNTANRLFSMATPKDEVLDILHDLSYNNGKEGTC